MDEHQRRVWGRLLEEVDAFKRGELTVGQLNSSLNGLVSAADIHDEELLREFWERRNYLFCEIAPQWFDSDESIPGGEADFRAWVAEVPLRSDGKV
jgi:hypothetical protein